MPVYPLLVPPVGYGDVKGVLFGKQASKLDDKEKLNDLRDDLTERLKLKPLRTSHWERKRDKFLAKPGGFVSLATAPTGPVAKTPTPDPKANLIVTSSGSWLKLHDRFYEAHKVHRHGKQNISVEIVVKSGEDEAALDHLRPPQHGRGQVIGYAYQNDGGLVHVEKMSSTSQGGKNRWSADLLMAEDRRGIFGEITYGNLQGRKYTPDDVAEVRAGRLLLNQPPPPKKKSRGVLDDDFESMIFETSGSPVPLADCVVRQIVNQHREDAERGLQLARLEAVFRLKAGGIVEQVLEFHGERH